MNNKFLLAAINAKYIHSNLAIRYIKDFCTYDADQILIKEFNINDSLGNILKEIYNSKCNIIAFSCYIWNIEIVLKLCTSIKKLLPKATIIVGGPEVSFDCNKLLQDNPCIDYVIIGEGELTFFELTRYINGEISDIKTIKGIGYRLQQEIYINEEREQIENLDILPFPYSNIAELENKIIYYETSRGCPFNCQYCLSSTIHGIRFFSLERVKADIKYFVNSRIKQIKLVDRTFNCDKKRCAEIMQYIIDLKPATNFHFEIAANLVDDKFLEILAQAPKGLFQFEIGIQSTNANTLSEISRKMNFEKVKYNVIKILELNNSHVHLDLIAGLPYEDYESFKTSFNDAYSIKPHMLQLGFLKLLKGSGLRSRASEYNIKYNEHPPYEVLSTEWLSYEHLLKLKAIEHLVDIYNNSGRFCNSLDYVLSNYNKDSFSFYNHFSDYWTDKGYYDSPKSLRDLFVILYEYITSNHCLAFEFNEKIKLDWILHCGSSNMPSIIKRYDHSSVKDRLNSYIKSSSYVLDFANRYLSIDNKAILKHISFEVISTNSSGAEADLDVMFFLKTPEGRIEYIIIPMNKILDASDRQ